MSIENLRGYTVPDQRRRAATSCPSHEWRLVADDVDEFGPVRMYECSLCGNVHFT